jgi:hypothetical protein
MQRGQQASAGELFVLEPEAVHTGMAAVPDGWAYKVLYVDPVILSEWAEREGSMRLSAAPPATPETPPPAPLGPEAPSPVLRRL